MKSRMLRGAGSTLRQEKFMCQLTEAPGTLRWEAIARANARVAVVLFDRGDVPLSPLPLTCLDDVRVAANKQRRCARARSGERRSTRIARAVAGEKSSGK